MTADWWLEFFDDEYAFLYSAALTPERTEREVAGAVAILRLMPGQRVLDLCCADGRHAVALQRRGMRVAGVDASAQLLRRASQRAVRVLGDAPGPALIRADVRALPVRRAFDAALLLFSSIGYGTDADTEAMFAAARGALIEGGQMLVECAHRDLHVRRSGPSHEAREWTEIGGVRVLTERRLDPVAGVESAVFRWGSPEVARHFRQRLYTPTELLPMLARAGFQDARVYGDYDRRAFCIDAPFLLVHARAR